MYVLQLLGTAALTDERGPRPPPSVAQPLRFAVLAVVASHSTRGVGRDWLAALFWPDMPDEKARQNLSDVVYRIRRALGATALRSEGDRIILGTDRIHCDLTDFAHRVDVEDWRGAVDVYRGPFLDGFHLRGCTRAFEEWVDGQVGHYARAYCEALERLVAADADATERIRHWQRLVEADPFNTRYAVGMVEALAEAGDPAGALHHAARHADRLALELGLTLPPSLERAVAQVEAVIEHGVVPSSEAAGRTKAGRPAGSDWGTPVGGSPLAREPTTRAEAFPAISRSAPPDRNDRRRALHGVVAASILVGIAVMASVWPGREAAVPPDPALLWLPSPFLPSQAPRGQTRLGPDGSAAVYAGPGPDGVGKQLWYRRFDEPSARPIPSTQFAGGAMFAISPDGREVAFVPFDGARQPIRVAVIQGASSRALGVEGHGVAAWTGDGIYYFASGARIRRVPSTGGDVETVTRSTLQELHTAYVPFGGSGRAILETRPAAEPWATSSELWVYEERTGARRRLFAGHSPRLSAGYLFFVTGEGALMAAPFDERSARLTGQPRVALDVPLAQEPVFGASFYDVSDNGTLVFTTGTDDTGRFEFGWVDRTGRFAALTPGHSFEIGVAGTGRRGWTLSPDRRRLAFQATYKGNYDVYTLELDNGVVSRLTSDPSEDGSPHWSGDGSAVWFYSAREDVDPIRGHLWSTRSDGGGRPSRLFPDIAAVAGIEGPDGTWAVVETNDDVGGGANVVQLPAAGPPASALQIDDDGVSAHGPALSPDGRWLAYESDERGREEVYVHPFPNTADAKWQVSSDGGRAPVWAPSAEELFYFEPESRSLVSVRFATGPTWRVLEREVLFRVPIDIVTVGAFYDASDDGETFLMARARPSAFADGTTRTDLKQNFIDELRRHDSR